MLPGHSSPDDSLARGLLDLKSGALLSLVGYALLFIMLVAALALVSPLVTFAMKGFSPPNLSIYMGFLSLLIIAFLAELVIAILAFYKFYKASSHFKEYNPSKLGIGKTGILLELSGVAILIIGVVMLFASLSLMGIAGEISPGPHVPSSRLIALVSPLLLVLGPLLIGLALIVVGGILFGIMIVRLAEVDGLDKEFMWAGILYIVGIILSLIPNIGIVGSLLGLVSTILMYSSSKKSLEALKGGLTGKASNTV